MSSEENHYAKGYAHLTKYWKPEAQLRSIVYIDVGAASGAVDALAAKVHPWKNRIGAHEWRSDLRTRSSQLCLTSPVKKSFICQAKPKFRKRPARHFFDAAEPVGDKHAALTSITAEGARPTTPQNQHRSLPFSCFSFNNFIKTNRQNEQQSLPSVLRGAERVIPPCSVGVAERTQPHPSESWARSILMLMSWSVRWMFSTTLDKRVKFQRTFLFRELWLDVDVTGPTAQCCRGVHAQIYLKTNDGSGERETRITLISHDVFHVDLLAPAWDRLTDGRKDQQNEDIEGAAALLKAYRYITVVPRLAVRLALRNQVARGRGRSSHVVFTFAESLNVCRDFTRSQRRRIVWSGKPPKLRCSTESEMTAFIFLTAAWR